VRRPTRPALGSVWPEALLSLEIRSGSVASSALLLEDALRRIAAAAPSSEEDKRVFCVSVNA
jgi:hypothetical protein